ncbi:MAG: threonylcarbamoyl-AMP synthase [Bacteroidia bacterium]|nr:threonylcarbamoyl-AMP synthase [Bacteroidia bacterium]
MAEIGKDILKAKTLLEQGELVAIPTETVYGLAGNALNKLSVAKIFQVKDRPQFDPLIVHVPNLEFAKSYVYEIPSKAELLTKHFWPGPLTLLLNRKSTIPDLVTSGLDTVGIRSPDHTLTRELLTSLTFPLAAPSANPFGYISPTRPEHVNEQLGDKISYILDGGVCKVGIESTIVGFENGRVIVYRMGGLSVESIEKVVGKVSVELNSSSNPKAPGQLRAHYAPNKKIILGQLQDLIKKYDSKPFGILSFQTDYQSKHQFILAPSGKIEEAAHNLFEGLRILDKMPVQTILAELVPDIGLGRAINDRLKRAAAN